jgi:hypothetical protein
MQPDPSMMAMHKNMDVMKEQKDRHVCDSSVATSQKLVPGAGSHQ